MKKKRDWLPAKPGMLRRERVDALLREGLGNALSLVIAGSGYGKTQAAAAWAQELEQRLIWLSLTEWHQTPRKFWEDFIHAAAQELPRLRAPLQKLGLPESGGALDAFLALLEAELREGGPVVLVADDFFFLEKTLLRAFFEHLIKAALPGLHILLISHQKPDWDINNAKYCGSQPDITGRELAFSPSETGALFAAYGLTPTRADVLRLWRETEGWPLALNLIGAQRRRGYPGPRHRAHLPYIFDLFEGAYFREYDPGLQDALVELSCLPCVPRELARDMREESGRDIVDFLLGHMFIAYNYADETFAFHNLYREFLASKQARLDPSGIARVFCRAAEYLLGHAHFLDAFYCYLRCGNFADMLRMLPEVLLYPLNRDEAGRMLDYLLEIPPPHAQSDLVAFTRACMHLRMLEVDAAQEILLKLRQAMEAKPPDAAGSRLLGEVYCKLGDICMLRETDGFAEYYKKSAALLPGGSRVRDPGMLFVGNRNVFFLVDNGPGGLARIVDITLELAGYSETLFRQSGYGFDMLFAAEAAFLLFDLEAATGYCYHAIRKAESAAQHDILCNAILLLARIALLQGDYAQLSGHMQALAEYVESRELTALYDLRDWALYWFRAQMGDMRPLARDAGDYAAAPLAELSGRSHLRQVSLLMAQERYLEALVAMDYMEPVFTQAGMWTVRLTQHILRAECLVQTGDRKAALASFGEAYAMAAPNGIVTPFIEFGNTMRRLIDFARRSSAGWDKAWMETVYRKASTFAKNRAAAQLGYNKEQNITPEEPLLTRREAEVLRHLSHGLSRSEIAEMLGISENGVKKHITGIFNKLGASNRADAMIIAVHKGLLEENADT